MMGKSMCKQCIQSEMGSVKGNSALMSTTWSWHVGHTLAACRTPLITWTTAWHAMRSPSTIVAGVLLVRATLVMPTLLDTCGHACMCLTVESVLSHWVSACMSSGKQIRQLFNLTMQCTPSGPYPVADIAFEHTKSIISDFTSLLTCQPWVELCTFIVWFDTVFRLCPSARLATRRAGPRATPFSRTCVAQLTF